MSKSLPFLLGLVIAVPTLASAATYVVDPGGGGDFTSLRAAVNAAAAGDRLEVAPGRYAESCTVTVGLEIVGTGGPDITILDGEQSRLIMWLRGANGCAISGLTFTGGRHDSGAAIHMSEAAAAIVSDCVFRGNDSTWDGGAIYTCQIGTRLDVVKCLFAKNHATHNGGAMGINTSSYVTITDCEFVGNVSDSRGGAVGNHADAHMTVTNCLFTGNVGGDAGALRSQDASTEITSCTFHENLAANGPSVHIIATDSVFERNIVSNASPQDCFFSAGVHDYNVFRDGDGVPGPQPLSDHEWYLDPGYCGFPAGDFTLCSTSPALPANNGHALLGRYGQGCVGCGPVPVENRTWGGLKAEYR